MKLTTRYAQLLADAHALHEDLVTERTATETGPLKGRLRRQANAVAGAIEQLRRAI